MSWLDNVMSGLVPLYILLGAMITASVIVNCLLPYLKKRRNRRNRETIEGEKEDRD